MKTAMARHILLKTEDEAKKLKEQIQNGKDFGLLAKKYSQCPSKKQSGDLGEISPGQLVKAIDQVVFKKSLKELHGPIKTKFGYHLVQVYFRQ
jgi:peptidyl-prolyl cis-trans isomerase C